MYKNFKYELPNYFYVRKVNLTTCYSQQKFIKHVKIPKKAMLQNGIFQKYCRNHRTVIQWIINHLRCFLQNIDYVLSNTRKPQEQPRSLAVCDKTPKQNIQPKMLSLSNSIKPFTFPCLTWWTKTSSWTSSLVIKPNPLTRLNHFTEPVISSLSSIFSSSKKQQPSEKLP